MGSSMMAKVVHAVAGVLAIGALLAGVHKLTPMLNANTHETMVSNFHKFNGVWQFLGLTADQLRMAVGGTEVAAALGSLYSKTRMLSYLAMVSIFGGAVYTHLQLQDEGYGPAAFFLLMACFCLGQSAAPKKPAAAKQS